MTDQEYIEEAKLHGVPEEEIKNNFEEVCRYIDDCNRFTGWESI